MSTGRRATKSAADPDPGVDSLPYLDVSRRPLHGLVFLAPLIIAYELGLVSVLSQRGGGIETVEAHRALLQVLSRVGFPPEVLLSLGGVVLAVLLLTWHFIRRDPWRIDGTTIVGMAAEAIVLTLPLLAFGSVLAGLARPAAAPVASFGPPPSPAIVAIAPAGGVRASGSPAGLDAAPHAGTSAAPHAAEGAPHAAPHAAAGARGGIVPVARRVPLPDRSGGHVNADVVDTGPETGNGANPNAPDGAAPALPRRNVAGNLAISIGAGLYEELFFRWILIAIVHVLLVDVARLSDRVGLGFAILCSAAAFAFYHDLSGPDGTIDFRRLTFFLVAGIYFGLIFAVRGYAMVAGVHAAYDVATVVLGGGE